MTGEPGCGKTTVIRGVVEALSGRIAMTGFTTEEIREEGRRRGFRGVTLDGRSFVLAHAESNSEVRVGSYGVETEGLERVGVPSLGAAPRAGLVVIDEVGKMESFSEAFRRAVDALLAGPTPVVGTVALHGVGFVKRVRRDPRITLVRMRRGSSRAMVGEILRRLERAGVAPGRGRVAETAS